MKSIALALALLLSPIAAKARDFVELVSELPGNCERDCGNRDAVVFIHGIFGSRDSFRSGQFFWPQRLPLVSGGRVVDVFSVQYDTSLLQGFWKDPAQFDEVVDELVSRLFDDPTHRNEGLLTSRGYRSLGFIAHSLGGNLAAAYLHSIKSFAGHKARARHSFLITLGTPVLGSQIANSYTVLKDRLPGLANDPLLDSLAVNNTFLRMFRRWRVEENSKANRFHCRPVDLVVAVEKAPVGPFVVVDESSASELRDIATEIRAFNGYNHLRIAKPESETDPLYQWVSKTIENEMIRLNDWGDGPLCQTEY